MSVDQTDTRGICVKCGAGIAVSKKAVNFGPMQVELRREYCLRCDFLVHFHRVRFRARPYRLPYPRPTATGEPPAKMLAEMEERMRQDGMA